MANTAEYTRKAVDKYRAKYDCISLRLPKGTKERIKKAGCSSVNDYIVSCVLEALDRSQPASETHIQPDAPDKVEQPHDWDYVNRILAEKRAQIGLEPVHEEPEQLPEQNEDDPESVKMTVQRMLEQIREGKEDE